jgi:hypothetical protein
VRADGKWTAGYYFNSALFRLAAVYHRALKTIAGKENEEIYIYKLLPTVTEQFQSWTNEVWEYENSARVYTQVNKLKHKPGGVYAGRAMTFDEAVHATDELLNLIESWR